MTELDELAAEVGASGRTLRRAAQRGTIRVERPTPRSVDVSAREHDYVRRHWSALRSALAVLRTRPNVRLAVLFGSLARGEADPASDADVIVTMVDAGWQRRVELASALETALGRRVQLVLLDDAPKLLLGEVLRDGRVLVDRDGAWRRLRRRARDIARAARAEDERLEREAWEAVDEPAALKPA